MEGEIPGERDGHSATIVGDHMFVFGGYEENYERFGQDVYRLDLNTFTWKLMVREYNYNVSVNQLPYPQSSYGEVPVHRDFHTATSVGGMMVIYGGRSSHEAGQLHHLGTDYYSNKVAFYNTSTSTWLCPEIRNCPLPSGRRSHSALSLDNGNLLIFGGYNG